MRPGGNNAKDTAGAKQAVTHTGALLPPAVQSLRWEDTEGDLCTPISDKSTAIHCLEAKTTLSVPTQEALLLQRHPGSLSSRGYCFLAGPASADQGPLSTLQSACCSAATAPWKPQELNQRKPWAGAGRKG